MLLFLACADKMRPEGQATEAANLGGRGTK